MPRQRRRSVKQLIQSVQAAANMLTQKRYFKSVGGKAGIRGDRGTFPCNAHRFEVARHLRGLRAIAGANGHKGAEPIKAAIRGQTFMPDAAEGCRLCGATTEKKTYPAMYGNKSHEEIVAVKGDFCESCRTGLLDGTYAAVGVAHEARAVRLGHAFYCHPDMKPALKSYSIMTATGSVPLPPRMPTIAGELSFQTVLKHHKERNNLQAQDNDRRAAAAKWEADQAAAVESGRKRFQAANAIVAEQSKAA